MMVQLTKMEQSVKIDELLQQIEEVKKKLHSDGNSSNNLNLLDKQFPSIVTPKEIFEPSAEYKSVQSSQVLQSSSVVIPKPKFAVQENQPRYTFAVPVKKNEEEQKTEPPVVQQNSNISLLEIEQQWNTIVDEMRKKKISAGTILGETSPLDLVNGTLRIACGDDFHQGTLLRNKEILAETINTIVHARIRIEPILHNVSLPTKETSRNIESKQSPVEPSSNISTSTDDHPLIKKLYSDFGAERV
jgi:regulator of replication initiation timing